MKRTKINEIAIVTAGATALLAIATDLADAHLTATILMLATMTATTIALLTAEK